MSVRTPSRSHEVGFEDSSLSRARNAGGSRIGKIMRAFGAAALLGTGVAACSDFSRQATRPTSAAADAGTPDAQVPDVQEPDAQVAPDAAVPDVQVPDVQEPDAQVPDVAVPDAAPPVGDSDGDGVPDDKDPCNGGLRPDTLDPVTDQARDSDNDGVSNGCDNCEGTANAGQEDQDGDLVGDHCDNAPGVANPSQSDLDNDGRGDAVDGCPDHPDDGTDNDADGVPPPCDCDDDNASVHPSAQDQACDDIDSNCDGVGKVSVTFPDSTVVIPGEPDCQCATGAARVNPQGLQAPCVGAQEVCVADGAGGSHFQTQVPAVLPTPEVEDDIDNNCNGDIDEGFACNGAEVQACGQGACAGNQTCEGGFWGACDGGAPSADVCNGVDDDCNGTPDDAYSPGEDCEGERGVCAGVPGVIFCKTELEADCSSNPGGSDSPALENDPCDWDDNDCDGMTDEDLYEGGFKNELCQGVGNCAFPGLKTCFGDAVICGSDVMGRAGLNPGMLESLQGDPAGSLCNLQDDDCDGAIDDGCGCAPNGPAFECGTDVGVCQKGVINCVNGVLEEVCNGPNYVGPTPEVCDGVDNDCEGRVDNLPEGTVGAACQGQGACGDVPGGFKECFVDANGESHIRCDTMPGGSFDQSSQEVCDVQGRDENCDGQSNEGNWAGAGAVNQPCALPGLCEGIQGHTRCVTDQATECSAIDAAEQGPEYLGPGNPNNKCDGVDNNCNSATDENCACTEPLVCGITEGICDDGLQACNNGTLSQECVGDIGPEPTEKCDSLDNDCDGVTDEGFNVLDANGQQVPCELPLPCGQGIIQCKPDGSAAICSAIAAATQEVCDDAIDNDCDGKADANDDQGCVTP